MHNHNTPHGLLLQLLPPASISFKRDDSEWKVLGGEAPLRLGYFDHLSFPDILFDMRSRLFVGLTFHTTDWDSVSINFSHADNRVVEFIPEAVETQLPTPRLDVRWTYSETLAFEAAQIADVAFYFQDDFVERTTKVAAIELRQIGDILASYHLKFPDKFLLDPAEVTWVNE